MSKLDIKNRNYPAKLVAGLLVCILLFLPYYFFGTYIISLLGSGLGAEISIDDLRLIYIVVLAILCKLIFAGIDARK